MNITDIKSARKPRAKRKATAAQSTEHVVHTVSPWKQRIAAALGVLTYAVVGATGVIAAVELTALVVPVSVFLALVVYVIGIIAAIFTALQAGMGVHGYVVAKGYDMAVGATKSVARRGRELSAWVFTPRARSAA